MTTFVFPQFRTFFNDAPAWGEQRLKFIIRRAKMSREVAVFTAKINASALWQDFFQAFPGEVYPLLHAYLDKRFRGRKRLNAMCCDLQCAEALLGENVLRRFVRGEAVVLAQWNDNLQLWLNHNDGYPDEGWWAVSLRNAAGERLYTASFAFIEGKRLLITSVQGPASEDAKAVVRHLTKQMYGLRPQQLMVMALQWLAQSLAMSAPLGIAQRNQVKLRWKLKKRVAMNYDLFWDEQHRAQQGKDGYWHLPEEPLRRDLADIESQKRSLYRKRYALLDMLQITFETNLKNVIGAGRTPMK